MNFYRDQKPNPIINTRVKLNALYRLLKSDGYILVTPDSLVARSVKGTEFDKFCKKVYKLSAPEENK